MKMVMVVIDEAKREELEVFLNHIGAQGYTEISHAAGVGTSGPRLGSRAFPKTSAVVFTVVDQQAFASLRAGVDKFCSSCGEQLKMFAWDVDEV